MTDISIEKYNSAIEEFKSTVVGSKFTIQGSSVQINFRYKCKESFSALTIDNILHVFQKNTVLRVDVIESNYAILTYTSFPDKKKISLFIDSEFEHLDKLINFTT